MSQIQRYMGEETHDCSPSVMLDLVEKPMGAWEAHLTGALPKDYQISVFLSEEKLLEATGRKPSGMILTFQFDISAECLSLRVTDPNGETVLLDNGYLHTSNPWNKEYAHAEITCETKNCHLCPYVVFLNNVEQLPV